MAVLRANIADLISKEFTKIFLPAFTKEPPIYNQIYREMNSNAKYEKFSGISGVGLIPEKTEGAPMASDEPIQLYDKTFTHKTYAMEVRITREAYEDDLSGALKQIPKMMGDA